MNTNETKLYATRPKSKKVEATIPEKTTSPWLPASLFFIVLFIATSGLSYFIKMEFDKVHKQFKTAETTLINIQSTFTDLESRVKNIEDTININDAEANKAGKSITSKIVSIESRITKSEKNIGWNSSRLNKQKTTIEEYPNNLTNLESTLNTQIAEQNLSLSAFEEKLDRINEVEEIASKVEKDIASNKKNILTMEQQTKGLSTSIQKIQGDIARFIRLYEKEKPTVKRVH